MLLTGRYAAQATKRRLSPKGLPTLLLLRVMTCFMIVAPQNCSATGPACLLIAPALIACLK